MEESQGPQTALVPFAQSLLASEESAARNEGALEQSDELRQWYEGLSSKSVQIIEAVRIQVIVTKRVAARLNAQAYQRVQQCCEMKRRYFSDACVVLGWDYDPAASHSRRRFAKTGRRSSLSP
jgi:hypothetical protein